MDIWPKCFRTRRALRMPHLVFNWFLGFTCALVSQPLAATLTCETSFVSVDYRQFEHAKLVCSSVEVAVSLFDQCNMPLLSSPLKIQLVDNLDGGCVGLYHCGQDLIEVLEPSLMASKRDPDGAFAFLPVTEFFRSTIVHEFAHAVTHRSPCPFGTCLIRDEYVAYAMQVMSLTMEQQAQFAAIAGLDRKISRDELSIIGLFMAPHLFSQLVWTHLTQRDDPCRFIGQLSKGEVLLDRERF